MSEHEQERPKRDPATDPEHDLRTHPQDPQARRPGELLSAYLRRLCASLPPSGEVDSDA